MITTAQVTIGMQSTLVKTADFRDGHNANDPLNFSSKTKYTNGDAASKANQHWHDKRSLSSGGNEELDLAGGLTDLFGDTVTFTKVKSLYIRNRSTTDTLLVGGAASNGWAGTGTPFANATDIILLAPGAEICINVSSAAGYTVTAGTGDKLKLAHGSTTTAALDYDIAILGVE